MTFLTPTTQPDARIAVPQAAGPVERPKAAQAAALLTLACALCAALPVHGRAMGSSEKRSGAKAPVAAAAQARAQAQAPAAIGAPMQAASSAREQRIRLRELGYPGGISLAAVGGVHGLTLRAPRQGLVTAARLVLRYKAALPAPQPPVAVQVQIAGRPIGSFNVEPGPGGEVEVSLNPALLSNSGVDVVLSTGIAKAAPWCIERDAGGIEFSDESELLLTYASIEAPGLGNALGGAIPGAERDRPARERTEESRRDRAYVQQLRDAHLALPAFAHISAATQKTRSAGALQLGEIGMDTATLNVAAQASWVTELPAWRVPAGSALNEVVIHINRPSGLKGKPAIVRASFNGTVLGNWMLRPGDTNPKVLPLPGELVNGLNRLKVDLFRVPQGDGCLQEGDSEEFRLLASSGFTLTPAPPARDLHQLAPLWASKADLVLGSGMVDPRALMKVLAGLLSPTTVLDVALSEQVPGRAHIRVSAQPPAGAKVALPLGEERVQIVTVAGKVLVDAEDVRRMTVAQLVRVDKTPVLWIRPGADFAQLAALDLRMPLAQGDVVLLSPQGVHLAFSSGRDHTVRIRYPDRFDIAEFATQQRGPLLLGLWIACTLGLLLLTRGVIVARRLQRPPQP